MRENWRRYDMGTVLADRHRFMDALLLINCQHGLQLIRHLEYVVMSLLSDHIHPCLRELPPGVGALAGLPVDKRWNANVGVNSAGYPCAYGVSVEGTEAPSKGGLPPSKSEIMYTPMQVPDSQLVSEELARLTIYANNQAAIVTRRVRLGVSPVDGPPSDFWDAPLDGTVTDDAPVKRVVGKNFPVGGTQWMDAWTMWSHYREWLAIDEWIRTPEEIDAMVARYKVARIERRLAQRLRRLQCREQPTGDVLKELRWTGSPLPAITAGGAPSSSTT